MFVRFQAAIPASPYPVLEFGVTSGKSDSLEFNADLVLNAATSSGDLPGLVGAVTTASKTVYAVARGTRGLDQSAAMDMDTVMFIASMTKPLTSTAALQLVEQGKLSLDAPAANFIPELGNLQVLNGYSANGTPLLRPSASPVTLRQLLNHTSGFAYHIWDANLNRYYTTTPNLPTMGSGERAALHVPLMFDPGTLSAYGIGTDWVGRMVETASGIRLGEYFRQNVTGPPGMSSTDFRISMDMRTRLASMHLRGDDRRLQTLAYEMLQNPEFESGGAGLYSTANDYLKFLRMILNKGQGNGHQILTPSSVDLMSHNAIGALRVRPLHSVVPFLSRDAEFFPGVLKTWSLGFMVNETVAPTGRSAGSLSWAGLANTFFWIDLKQNIAGLAMMQLFPFFDDRAVDFFYNFETNVYASTQRSQSVKNG